MKVNITLDSKEIVDLITRGLKLDVGSNPDVEVRLLPSNCDISAEIFVDSKVVAKNKPSAEKMCHTGEHLLSECPGDHGK